MAAQLPIEAEEFLAWMLAEKGRSANTLAAYRRDLDGYLSWLGEQGLDLQRVQREHVTAFVGARRESGAASSSVARQLAAIRMLHRYLTVEGHRETIRRRRWRG